MDPDAVALVLPRTAGKPADIRVVTRAEGGALLCADLDGMLGAVVALADNEALRAFPGGEFLIDALRTGLTPAVIIGPWLNALLAWGSVVVLVGLGLAARRRSPRNAKTPTP